MKDEDRQTQQGTDLQEHRPRELTPAAQRALKEAEERRIARDEVEKTRQKELGGRKGPEPVRYGDWEKGGIASDF